MGRRSLSLDKEPAGMLVKNLKVTVDAGTMIDFLVEINYLSAANRVEAIDKILRQIYINPGAMNDGRLYTDIEDQFAKYLLKRKKK